MDFTPVCTVRSDRVMNDMTQHTTVGSLLLRASEMAEMRAGGSKIFGGLRLTQRWLSLRHVADKFEFYGTVWSPHYLLNPFQRLP